MFKQVLQNKRKNIHKDNLEHVLKFEKKKQPNFLSILTYTIICVAYNANLIMVLIVLVHYILMIGNDSFKIGLFN